MIRLALVAIALVWAGAAQAIPVRTYALDLQFETCTRGGSDCLPTDAVHAGSRHTGYFSIAEDVFATEGYHDVGFESFYLQLGETIWNSQAPFPGSDFVGTRGYNPVTGVGGFVPWTLLVENGDLAGICCGVYGAADFPFVDLASWPAPDLPFGPNYLGATGYLSRDQLVTFGAEGTFAIHRVPEPSTLVLLLIGMALLIRLRFAGSRCGCADRGTR